MGVMVTDRRRGLRALAAVLFGVTLMALLLLLLPTRASGAGQPLFATSENAAGRYDTVVLRDLGKRTAAVVSMVAAGDAFTADELWRSRKGKLDVRKVKWLAADVNADGIADGVALLDLGRGRSRFVFYLNDGDKAVPKTAWTSKKGAFFWARAKLAVGDLNGDGRDDVIALYDRGKSGVALYSFMSTGSALTMSTGWTAPRASFSWAKSQLAAGDFTRDGIDDALVLYATTPTASQLIVFASGASGFTEAEFWSGEYAAGGVQLAAGDVNSDGVFDAVCLARKPDGTGRLDVFLSTGSMFSGPAPWYDGAGLPGTGCSFVVGDLTGDGRADGVIARSTGKSSSGLTVCVSTGSAFTPTTWWSGPWRYGGLRVGCAPSPGLVISDKAEVADAATLDALSGVAADGTLTFARKTEQLQQLETGDVLISAPDAANPQGIFRKVSGVSESGGVVTVATTKAGLDDVVECGQIGFVKRVTAADLSQDDITLPGARLVSRRGDPLITFAIESELKVKVGSVTQTAVKVKGRISLDPTAYFSYDAGFLHLHSVSFTQVMKVTSDLDVEVTADLAKELELDLVKLPLATMAVVVPPGVPIWVTPMFKVYVGASGDVGAGVTAGLTETCTATLNIAWANGDFLPPTATSVVEREWRKPKLFGDAMLRAYAGAGLDFLLYSVAGPYASIEAGPVLEAGTERKPWWWELYAAVDVEIGVKLDLGFTSLKSSFPAWRLYTLPIDRARTGYGTQGVSGKVTAADTGQPLAGVTVDLRQGTESPTGTVWGTTTTSATGTYSFAGPPAGEYTLTATKARYKPGQLNTRVWANVTTEGQDLALRRDTAPTGDVQGVVRNAATNAPLPGATVEIRRGADNPFGTVFETATTAADGAYAFLNVPSGEWTVVARKAGFEPNSRTVDIATGIRSGHDILLSAVGPRASMRSAQNGHILWARSFDAIPNATFELWFRPIDVGGVDYGSVIAQISRDYADWMGGGLTRWPVMQIQYAGSPTSPVAAFWINEDIGDDRGQKHRLTGTTPLLLGIWHHIAVQYGSLGMKLYVDGRLEASNTYTKRPEANRGADAGGWFSLGDNDTLGSGYMTAVGDFRGLRVSTEERYPNDFLPQDLPVDDGPATIHDLLAGSTNGGNVNFVPTPTTP